MWTDEHVIEINNFLSSTAQQILLVYVDKHRGLSLSSTIPTYTIQEVAYFARYEGAVITPENFTQVVQFGKIGGNCIDSLLRSMHDIYAPTFFENDLWPDSESHRETCSVHVQWNL